LVFVPKKKPALEMGLYYARTFDFKAKDCDELKGLDIGFAIKEYLQNSVGQILKTLQVRVWRDWDREDLTADVPENIQKRRECKKTLVQEAPQMFAGEQGLYLKSCPLAQPLYVLKKWIPPSKLRSERRPHDLRVTVVLWNFPNATALTVYNNYLDRHATFDHFAYDGASTSKDSKWAVGLKGKGFILATSYLAQECLSCCDTSIDARRIGVGFNVGSRVCRARYNDQHPNMLKVKREDLRALTLEAFKQESR
jgi:hypothetical protein